jgi:Ser/Thr protein kinase RdoA (MazF antagonist)
MHPLASAPAARALAEFDVGDVLRVEVLGAAGGSSGTARKVVASTGTYVLKPAYRVQDVELQAEIAPLLTARGVRQPGVIRTTAGSLVAEAGFYLLEFLPGAPMRDPSPDQVAIAMWHVGEFHRALGEIPVIYEPDRGSLWTRVTDPGFLLAAMPGLLARHGLAENDVLAALDYLDRSSALVTEPSRQVVHGDIGPDNIVMDASGAVVSLIDFTPHLASVMFAATTALYWFHVYEHSEPRPEALRDGLASVAVARPWTQAELAAWPASLVLEAMRRLATALALSGEPGTGAPDASSFRPPVPPRVGPSVEPRLAAARAVVRMLPELA